MKYSEECREAVLRKLLPPENRHVAEVAVEKGISAPTLYAWRKQARAKGRLLPTAGIRKVGRHVTSSVPSSRPPR